MAVGDLLNGLGLPASNTTATQDDGPIRSRSQNGTEGEFKLYGLARRVEDHDEIERYCVALFEAIGWRPDGPDDFDLWVLDLLSGAHQYFAPDEGNQFVKVWKPGEGLRSSSRQAA